MHVTGIRTEASIMRSMTETFDVTAALANIPSDPKIFLLVYISIDIIFSIFFIIFFSISGKNPQRITMNDGKKNIFTFKHR